VTSTKQDACWLLAWVLFSPDKGGSMFSKNVGQLGLNGVTWQKMVLCEIFIICNICSFGFIRLACGTYWGHWLACELTNASLISPHLMKMCWRQHLSGCQNLDINAVFYLPLRMFSNT
jgi:hypothetical protein